MDGYIGTYASPDSLGVYRFIFHPQTGIVEMPTLFCGALDAKYAALSGGILAAPVRREDRAGVLAVECSTGLVLDELLCERIPACYVTWRNDRLFTANYHEGTVCIYRWSDGKLYLQQKILVAPKAGCHQCLFYGSLLLIPCLERDEVRLYDLDQEGAPAGCIALPPRTGPRHGLFRGNTLYLVGERSCRLLALRAGSWKVECSVPIADQGASAAIRMSVDRRFLYVSTRGANEIAVFQVDDGQPEQIQRTSCAGEHPRDILLSPDGRFLLVVNRDQGGLVSFALDQETGKIKNMVSRAELHQGVSLCMEERTD